MPPYKPISNNFFPNIQTYIPAGSPNFYEREEVFASIQDRLRSGECVSLVGERKAGKTSFLQYLSAHLPTDEFIPVFVDTQRVFPQKDKVFLGLLIKSAAQAIKKAVGLAKPIKVETPTVDSDEKGYETFENDLEQLRAKLPLNANRQKLCLVWLVDEIETLRSYHETNLFKFLRFLVQTNPSDFRMVVAGYDVLYTLSSRSEWSPFFNAFGHVRLTGLNPVTAQQLINDALAIMGATIESNLYEPILDWTGQKPYFLKWILLKTADALNQRQNNYHISADVLEIAQNLFLSQTELSAHFTHLWETHLTKSQQTILSLIAAQTGPYNHPKILDNFKNKKLNEGDKQAAQHLIDNLTRLKQLSFLYEQVGRYTFTSGCLQDWIKKNKPLD